MQHEAALLCKTAVAAEPDFTLQGSSVAAQPGSKRREQLHAELRSGVSPDTIEVKLSRAVQAVAVSEGVLHRRSANSVMVDLKQSSPQG